MIDDRTFQKQMHLPDKWAAAWSYVTGLKRWMEGDAGAAALSFRRCLTGVADLESRPDEIPQKWAWEDLQHICRLKPLICGDLEGDVSGVK